MLDTILVAVAFACGAILLTRSVRDNHVWRATVTPLASIIGSGFLVIVPLLGNAVGGYAPIAMLGIVLLAYLVGDAIRFNIEHAEPLLTGDNPWLRRLERLSDVALALAYFISVTFYLRLLAAFALRGLEIDSEFAAKVITSVVLAGIALAGWSRGLDALERLEEYSVSVKLAIIASLLLGWGVHDVSTALDGHLPIAASLPKHLDPWATTRLLAGVLIVVQGFETSRYLGDEYDGAVRRRTMRYAQMLSGVIYVVFVAMAVPTLGHLSTEVSETAIIDLSSIVAPVLPPLIVIAALMSQFSAAVADTVGAGGLVSQTFGQSVRPRVGYVAVAVAGVVLVWTADIFRIISLASRAFASYYAIQCAVAALAARHAGNRPRVIWFVFLALTLSFAAVVAVPAG